MIKDTKYLQDIIKYWSNSNSMDNWGGFDERDIKLLKSLRKQIVDIGKNNEDIPNALAELIVNTDKQLHSYEAAILKKISLRNGMVALTSCWNEYQM